MILIADVDRSGGVTLVDILEMQKYIAKMATSCEIGKIFGTEEPTQAPTARPTDPTQAPTEKPTEAPTEQPTDKPADSYTVYLKTRQAGARRMPITGTKAQRRMLPNGPVPRWKRWARTPTR